MEVKVHMDMCFTLKSGCLIATSWKDIHFAFKSEKKSFISSFLSLNMLFNNAEIIYSS
jgi:hypothetical protein